MPSRKFLVSTVIVLCILYLLPTSLLLSVLPLFRAIAAAHLIAIGINEAFYPPTWIYPSSYRSPEPVERDPWRLLRD